MMSRTFCIAFVWSGLCTSAAFGQVVSTSVDIQRSEPYPHLSFAGMTSGATSTASGNNVQLPVTSAGAAAAGNGTLSTFATATCDGSMQPPMGSPALATVGVTARASLMDSVTFITDSTLPVTLRFALRASGSIATTRMTNSPAGGAFEASVSWQASLGASSASGGLREDYPFLFTPFARTKRLTQSGLGLSEAILIATVQPGLGGSTMTLTLSSESFAGGDSVFLSGEKITATADFGSTLRWLGLASAVLPDGSPFTGQVSAVGASGFNYLIPQPSAFGLFALAGAWNRRRRRG